MLSIHMLLPTLLVGMVPDAPLENRFPEAATVFQCNFDESWDINFDGNPDRWQRVTGPRFNHWVTVKINREPSPAGNVCLRMDLDGGAVGIHSPPITISTLYNYVLEAYVKTESLEYDEAFISIRLLNEQDRVLQTVYSDKVRRTQGWQKIRIGPFSPISDDVSQIKIGLHVEPTGMLDDLKGAVLFDDIWLGQLPRITLETNHPFNMFLDAEPVEMICTASGSLQKDPEVVFVLEDVTGQVLATQQRRLSTRPAIADSNLSLDSFTDEPAGMIGTARWKPPLQGPGFYRVRVAMKGREAMVYRQELNLVVVKPQRGAVGGEFGFTLPHGDKPVPLTNLVRILRQAGISWVKYPVWCDTGEKNAQYIKDLARFGDRLNAQGIEMVGLLHDPPESLKKRYRDRYSATGSLTAAAIFAPDPKVWYPSLQPVITQLATQVRWWQLGDDHDTSFAGHPKLREKLGQIKDQLNQIGQDVSLGVGWDWLDELPVSSDKQDPWRFLVLSADPPMTHRELAEYLGAAKDVAFQRWVVVRPLSNRHYSVEDRAVDLVRRVIAAKIAKVEGIFCPDPFDPEHGLMNSDGTPGELFLPWRTVALTLGAAEHIGSIQLPGGSRNLVFARGDDAVMVVWNDRPTKEVIYLGDDVEQIDLFGRHKKPLLEGHRQVIEVDHLPSFIVGVNEPITHWRMNLALTSKQLPAVFLRPHANSYRVKNPFARGVGGRATLVAPPNWKITPEQATFRVAANQSWTGDFQIRLPSTIDSGRHPIRVDFELQADRTYKFSVYRSLSIGLGDVYVEIATHMSEQGDLVVEQRFVNESDRRVSFQCQLFAPGRRVQTRPVVDLGRSYDLQTYVLPDGKELLGTQFLLRAQELRGQSGRAPRTINRHFIPKP